MAIFKVLAFAASCVGLVAAFSSPPELDEFNGLKISTGISTQLEGIFKLPRKFQKQQIQNLFLYQQQQQEHQQEQWNKQLKEKDAENVNLHKTVERLTNEKEQAIQSAGLGEFLLCAREGVAHFEETWSAGMPTDVHQFAVEISKKTNITTDRLKKGKKHFRKWMYILVSGDADRCMGIGKLRKSLNENPIKYLWFAFQMEVIFEVLCEPAHPKNPLKMKYMDKARFMEYAKIFVGEPRDAIIHFLENVFY